MSEALEQHLLEQQEAAERDWHRLSSVALRYSRRACIVCVIGGPISLSHFWLRECDWPWLIVQLVGSAMQAGALASMLWNGRRFRAADAAHAVVLTIMAKRMKRAVDEMHRAIEKQQRGY